MGSTQGPLGLKLDLKWALDNWAKKNNIKNKIKIKMIMKVIKGNKRHKMGPRPTNKTQENKFSNENWCYSCPSLRITKNQG